MESGFVLEETAMRRYTCALTVGLLLCGCSGRPTAQPTSTPASTPSPTSSPGAATNVSGADPSTTGGESTGSMPSSAHDPGSDPNSPKYPHSPSGTGTPLRAGELPPHLRIDPPEEFPKAAVGLRGYDKARVEPIVQVNSIQLMKAKDTFLDSCAPCHGKNGDGHSGNKVRTHDLRLPYLYKYGTGQRALYRTIMYGIPGTSMGTYDKMLKPEDVWPLVGYVQSLMKEETGRSR